MRAVIVLPSTGKGLNRTYAGRPCSMSVSEALEFDLPVGDGPAGPEGDETIYCDFSMLPEEMGQRAGRALASMAAALRGDDSEFPWGEPDPVGVGIALQVLSFLPERTKIGKGPVYRIAFHEVAPDAGAEGDQASSRDRHDFVSAKESVGNGSGRTRRYFNAKDAAAYLGLSARTLNRMRVPGKGPRYTKKGRRVIYDIADLDDWMAEDKR